MLSIWQYDFSDKPRQYQIGWVIWNVTWPKVHTIGLMYYLPPQGITLPMMVSMWQHDFAGKLIGRIWSKSSTNLEFGSWSLFNADHRTLLGRLRSSSCRRSRALLCRCHRGCCCQQRWLYTLTIKENCPNHLIFAEFFRNLWCNAEYLKI